MKKTTLFQVARKSSPPMPQIISSPALVTRPLCSVCIANYNGIHVIGPCVESVLFQDFEHPVEIIVHDDASTDGSVASIRSRFPNVKLLTSDTNVGFCVSNNRMVAQARGSFVLLLNNDAALFPDALRTLHSYAVGQNEPGILGLPQYNMQTGELIDIGSHLDLFLSPIPNRDRNRLKVGMVSGACLWIPKALWSELGGFPEFFGSLAEDLYLCCLARLRGYPVEALSQSGFHHWVGKSLGGGKLVNNTLRTSYRRRALSERNRIFVMILTYPLLLLTLLIPFYSMLLMFECLTISLLRRNARLWNQVFIFCIRQVHANLASLGAIRRGMNLLETSRRYFITELKPTYHKLSLVLKHGIPLLD
jgi:GT2 family glycosyltransferase